MQAWLRCKSEHLISRGRSGQAPRLLLCQWFGLGRDFTPEGSPVNPDTMSSRWNRFLKRSGLPDIRFHDLRHGHATLMLLQGVHPKVVSERLGHASVGITLDTYSHVLPSMQTEAAQAFDQLFGAQTASLGPLPLNGPA